MIRSKSPQFSLVDRKLKLMCLVEEISVILFGNFYSHLESFVFEGILAFCAVIVSFLYHHTPNDSSNLLPGTVLLESCQIRCGIMGDHQSQSTSLFSFILNLIWLLNFLRENSKENDTLSVNTGSMGKFMTNMTKYDI